MLLFGADWFVCSRLLGCVSTPRRWTYVSSTVPESIYLVFFPEDHLVRGVCCIGLFFMYFLAAFTHRHRSPSPLPPRSQSFVVWSAVGNYCSWRTRVLPDCTITSTTRPDCHPMRRSLPTTRTNITTPTGPWDSTWRWAVTSGSTNSINGTWEYHLPDHFRSTSCYPLLCICMFIMIGNLSFFVVEI